MYWDMATRKVVSTSPTIRCLVNIPFAQVVHQEKQENIQQIFYYKNQSRCVVVSKKGSKGNESGLCVSRFSGKVQTWRKWESCCSRSVPEGTKQWEFEFPFVTFIKVGTSPKCSKL